MSQKRPPATRYQVVAIRLSLSDSPEPPKLENQKARIMAKYYVQSGSLRGVVDSFDEECAAVWAINLVMRRSSQCDNDAGMFALDDTVHISERGFDRDDCIEIDTHMAFVQWHQLQKAIESLCDRLDEMLDS
ncbi:MAG: hypothetical protein ABL921_00185 [Pirellula sp.]